MIFTHDTEEMLQMSAALVNTALDGEELLRDAADLDAFLEQWPVTGSREASTAELAAVHEVRALVQQAWGASDRDALVEVVNDLFARTDARPYLARHDEWDWHLHVAQPSQALAERIGAEAAMGLADLVRADDVDRLRTCAAEGCAAVLVDLSRNRSRRFCGTGCANRTHVAAYRARQATDA